MLPTIPQQKPQPRLPKSTSNPPVLTPSGLPITSGAVIRSVAPKVKNQFAKMPNPGMSYPQASSMNNPRMSVPVSSTVRYDF